MSRASAARTARPFIECSKTTRSHGCLCCVIIIGAHLGHEHSLAGRVLCTRLDLHV